MKFPVPRLECHSLRSHFPCSSQLFQAICITLFCFQLKYMLFIATIFTRSYFNFQAMLLIQYLIIFSPLVVGTILPEMTRNILVRFTAFPGRQEFTVNFHMNCSGLPFFRNSQSAVNNPVKCASPNVSIPTLSC